MQIDHLRISPFLLLVLILLCETGHAQKSPVIADGAELQLISDQFSFTEGPAVDDSGNVFFTDQPNNQIWEFSTDGKLTLFMDDVGRSNGMYVDQQGNLITAADKRNELWSITPNKKVHVLVKNFKGHRLNGPNDLWIDPQGGIYFTDPYYQRDYWERTQKDIEEERVYYLSPDREQMKIVANNLEKPNGIIGTSDGKTLYIADIGAGKTYRYAIKSGGELADQELFTDMGSDGMTIDSQGNIYLTGKGVTVFNPKGEKIEHLPVDEDWTANVTFGRPNRQTLFITASKSLYKIDMKVQGAR